MVKGATKGTLTDLIWFKCDKLERLLVFCSLLSRFARRTSPVKIKTTITTVQGCTVCFITLREAYLYSLIRNEYKV